MGRDHVLSLLTMKTYLAPTFAEIANQDDVAAIAALMEEVADLAMMSEADVLNFEKTLCCECGMEIDVIDGPRCHACHVMHGE